MYQHIHISINSIFTHRIVTEVESVHFAENCMPQVFTGAKTRRSACVGGPRELAFWALKWLMVSVTGWNGRCLVSFCDEYFRWYKKKAAYISRGQKKNIKCWHCPLHCGIEVTTASYVGALFCCRWRPHFIVTLFGTNDAKSNNWDAESFQKDKTGTWAKLNLLLCGAINKHDFWIRPGMMCSIKKTKGDWIIGIIGGSAPMKQKQIQWNTCFPECWFVDSQSFKVAWSSYVHWWCFDVPGAPR